MNRTFLRMASCSAVCVALPLVADLLASPEIGRQDQGPQTAVYVMNADGSDLKKLVQVENYRWHGSPAWSRDGRRLVFDAHPGPAALGNSHIFVVSADGSGLKDLGPGGVATWSPDDKQLAFYIKAGSKNAETAKPGVWVMNADGSGREWLHDGDGPAWSPDGGHISFCSQHEGFPSIYLLDTLDGGVRRVLDEGYRQVVGNAWSPDGKWLAFRGVKAGEQTHVAIVSVADEGREIRVLARGRVGWRPAWSADGQHVAFNVTEGTPRGVQRLQVVNINEPDRLEPLPQQDAGSYNTDPAWSPDGQQIAFCSDR